MSGGADRQFGTAFALTFSVPVMTLVTVNRPMTLKTPKYRSLGTCKSAAERASCTQFVDGQSATQCMEVIMNGQSPSPSYPTAGGQKGWQEAREAPFAREKAHTREGGRDRGGAPAAADGGGRRHYQGHLGRELHPSRSSTSSEGCKQLIVYFHAWWPCLTRLGPTQGCTFFRLPGRELPDLHSAGARCYVRHALGGPGPGERPLSGLPGSGHAVVLGRKDGGATPGGS